jgi:hypothetical protein
MSLMNDFVLKIESEDERGRLGLPWVGVHSTIIVVAHFEVSL